jgi:hypothetical protein
MLDDGGVIVRCNIIKFRSFEGRVSCLSCDLKLHLLVDIDFFFFSFAFFFQACDILQLTKLTAILRQLPARVGPQTYTTNQHKAR